VHCTKISPKFEIGGLKVKVTWDRKTCLALPTSPGCIRMYAFSANSVQRQRTGPFCGYQGVFSGACVLCV